MSVPLPVPKAPSLALRGLLAVVLLAGFYLLAAAIVGGLLYIPYAEWHYLERIDRFSVLAAVAAFAVLSGVIPRIDRFPDPGVRLRRGAQDRLFSVVDELARATGQASPKDVFLVVDFNAWVAQRGGIMGFGSHRVMGLGLPLLQTLTVDELRAVLAHEFGHYYAGDTALGPWLYKTRAAIERTLRNLSGRSWVRAPFVWYGKAFLRITHRVSRSQEIAADALAARIVGAGALASGLRKIHAAAPLFHAYWISEVGPVLDGGMRPPIRQGFEQFLAADASRERFDDNLEAALAESASPYDTHPSLRERLAALAADGPPRPDTSGPAMSLLADRDDLEQPLLAAVLPPTLTRRLHAATWAEVNTGFWLPRWEQLIRSRQDRLVGLTPARLASFAGHPERPAIHLRITPDEAHASDAHKAEGLRFLGAALAVLLAHRGWEVRAMPGHDVVFVLGPREIAPFTLLAGLLRGAVTPEAWLETWSATAVGDEDLGTLATSLPSPLTGINA